MAAAALSSTPLPVSRPARPPPPARSNKVSLRPLKDMAEKLPLAHPLRILLTGEPDELPRVEYGQKATGWFRLLLAKAE